MGVIRRLRTLAWYGVILLGFTAVAVVWQAYQMREKFGEGQALDPPADLVIVLGSGVEPDGILSYSSRRRVQMGVWLLENGKARRLVMTGGRFGYGQDPIGEKMRDLAVSLGARPDQVLFEGRSRTTVENLHFAMEIARAENAERIGLLTDHFHLTRAQLLAEYLGYPGLLPVSAQGAFQDSRYKRVHAIGRETIAWWYNIGKVVAWEVLAVLGYSEEERARMVF